MCHGGAALVQPYSGAIAASYDGVIHQGPGDRGKGASLLCLTSGALGDHGQELAPVQGCGFRPVDPRAVTHPKPHNPATVHGQTAPVLWLSDSTTRKGLAGATARHCNVTRLHRCNILLSPLLVGLKP